MDAHGLKLPQARLPDIALFLGCLPMTRHGAAGGARTPAFRHSLLVALPDVALKNWIKGPHLYSLVFNNMKECDGVPVVELYSVPNHH